VDIEELAVLVARDFQGELLVELFLPLVEHRLGRQDQAALDPAGDQQLADHQAGFDGFAQPDLIAQHGPAGEIGQKLVRHARLMRPGCDGGGGRAQPGRAWQIGGIAQKLEQDALGVRAATEIDLTGFRKPVRSGPRRFQRVALRRVERAEDEQAISHGGWDVEGNPVRFLVQPQPFEIRGDLGQVSLSSVPREVDGEGLVVLAPGGLRFVDAA